MTMLTYKAILCYWLFSEFVILTCKGQAHLLKYINTGTTPPPLSTPQFDSSTVTDAQMRNTMDQFSRAEKLCVQGMWALFNTTNYGEGAEDSTMVISVRGTDIRTCTQPGQVPVLRNVQSLHYLGNKDYAMDGIFIYSQSFMLGGMWDVPANGMLPTGVTGVPLGSIAVTGDKQWVICGTRGDQCSGVCINMKNHGRLFMNRNPQADTSIPNGWPKIVRQVRTVTEDECKKYPSPTQPNTRRLIRSVHNDIEIIVSVPSL